MERAEAAAATETRRVSVGNIMAEKERVGSGRRTVCPPPVPHQSSLINTLGYYSTIASNGKN
jgi:hypothetical protein